MNKKEPTKYNMSTGLPIEDEVQKYPLEGAEKSFLNFIAQQKKSRAEYNKGLEKIRKESKDST
tara:strand:- start:1360 stop:1548 length:189 start_codon:yes stop_codon:yes gene_type:complete